MKFKTLFVVLALSLSSSVLSADSTELFSEDNYFTHIENIDINDKNSMSMSLMNEIDEVKTSGMDVNNIKSKTIYLKLSDPENADSYVPLTKNEVSQMTDIKEKNLEKNKDHVIKFLDDLVEKKYQPYSSGGTSATKPYSKLTLTLISTSVLSGGKRIINAKVHSVWNTNYEGTENHPNINYDFISMTLPPAYMVTDSTMLFSPGTPSYWKHDETNSGVVYTYRPVILYNGGVSTNAKYSTLYVNGAKTGTSSTQQKVVAKYVHTWSSLRPSVSISGNSNGLSGGISISLTDKSWQLTVSDLLYA